MHTWQEIQEQNKKLIGKEVVIRRSDKPSYSHIVGLQGVVERVSGSTFGVRIFGMTNKASKEYGLYWFRRSEFYLISQEVYEMLSGYKYVAKVKLLEDRNQKDYWFALYEEDMNTFESTAETPLVITTAGGYNNRVLGRLIDVVPAEECEIEPTAEIVAIVNTSNFDARQAKARRIADIRQRHKVLTKQLDAELVKKKTIDHYVQMAKDYPEDKLIQNLVAELVELNNELEDK